MCFFFHSGLSGYPQSCCLVPCQWNFPAPKMFLRFLFGWVSGYQIDGWVFFGSPDSTTRGLVHISSSLSQAFKESFAAYSSSNWNCFLLTDIGLSPEHSFSSQLSPKDSSGQDPEFLNSMSIMIKLSVDRVSSLSDKWTQLIVRPKLIYVLHKLWMTDDSYVGDGESRMFLFNIALRGHLESALPTRIVLYFRWAGVCCIYILSL